MPIPATSTWQSRPQSGSDRALAGMLLASCLVVPLLFTIASQDTFALPKVTALRIIAVAGLILFAVRMAANGIRKTALVGRLDIAVLAFVLLNIAACAFSIDPRQSLNGEYLQYQGLLTILLYVCFFYLARTSLRDERRVTLLFASIAAGGTIVAAYALVQKAGFDPIWSYVPRGRVFSSIGQANALAAYLVLAIPVSASLLARTQSLARGTILVTIGMMVAALALTLSRGGYAGFIVAASIGAIPLVRSLRLSPRGVLYALIPSLAAAVVVGALVQPVRETATQVWNRAVSSTDLGDSSFQGHRDLWTVGAHIALDNPVLGTGQETFPELFPQYKHATLDQRKRVQHIADGAALAGAQELPEDMVLAEDVARQWADRNGLDGRTIDVSFQCRADVPAGCQPSGADTIVVTSPMRAPLALMPVVDSRPDRATIWRSYRPESPHNVYLAIAAGSGFPALAAYVALIAGFFYMVERTVKTSRNEWRGVALVALLAAVSGHLVTDMFMTAEVTGSWLFWILMGAGLGLVGGWRGQQHDVPGVRVRSDAPRRSGRETLPGSPGGPCA